MRWKKSIAFTSELLMQNNRWLVWVAKINQMLLIGLAHILLVLGYHFLEGDTIFALNFGHDRDI